MEMTADLDMNAGSEQARGSWRPVPLMKTDIRGGLPDFAEWKEEDWMEKDNSELFEARCVPTPKILHVLQWFV
jgi:hypothetical protein